MSSQLYEILDKYHISTFSTDYIMMMLARGNNDLDIDIDFGDYVGYYDSENFVRYYTVVNDGRVISDTKHTYKGFKPFYRTIIAAPVGPNEFRGL